MQVFEDSWVGDRSREVARELFYWMALVDLMFFCWMHRWTFLVAMVFLRCFELKKAVIPVQVFKWPQLMARKKVDRMGLETVPWRNAARSICFGAQ